MTRFIIHALGVAGTAVLLWRTAGVGDWSPGWLVIGILVLAPLGELSARRHEAPVRLSATELLLVPAMVLLGPLPAAAASALTTVTDITRGEPDCGRSTQTLEIWVHLLWPVVGSLMFFALSGPDTSPAQASFLAATAAAAVAGMTVNLGLVWLIQLLSPPRGGRHSDYPTLAISTIALFYGPVVVASVGVVAAYGLGGPYALGLVVAALFAFHWLIDQLLLLRERERELKLRNRQLAAFQVDVLALLTGTLARRDQVTARHSAAVSRWAADLAGAGSDTQTQWTVRTAGLLHDIGKFVLPDTLLLHNGDLSDRQRQELRAHAHEGAELVARIPGLQPVARLIRHHHERFDGTGYPDGLAGEQIPLGSRLLAICEAYDAMTARDSYLAPRAPSEAMAELRAEAGKAFDPVLVDRFIALLERRGAAYRHGESVSFERALDELLAENRMPAPPSARSRRRYGAHDVREPRRRATRSQPREGPGLVG